MNQRIKVEEERRKEKSERNVDFNNLISGEEVTFIEKMKKLCL